MGKIKNWKNIGQGAWEHEKYERRELMIKEGMDSAHYGDARPGEYVIVLDTPIEHTMLKHDNQQPKVFQNWENAREEAVAWMREHPYANNTLYSVYDPQSGKVVGSGRNSESYIAAVEAAERYMEIGTDEERTYEQTRVQVFEHSKPIDRGREILPDDAEFIDKGKTTL